MKAASVSLSQLDADLRMADRAKGTIQQYLASARRFEEFLGTDVSEAEQEAIRHRVDHLLTQPIGPERLWCHYSALKFIYGRTLGQPEKVAFISMPRKDSPLPTALSPAEIQRVLDGFLVAKYRVFFALIYATGLRIREASLLQTSDIDSMQQVIHVRHGKGGRERLVPMNAKRYGHPRFDIADIVRQHRRALEAEYRLSRSQKRVLTLISLCRTAALGGHLEVCSGCGREHPVYNSCRNRHCPTIGRRPIGPNR